MTPVALFLAMAAAQGHSAELSLSDRCALLATILHAPAKRGLQGSERPRVVELSFLQDDPVRDSATRRSRVIVRSQWRLARGYADIFGGGESCDDGAFVLEHADPEERKSSPRPEGNSDHVVVVTIEAARRKGDEFAFEETLGLSIHARPPDGTTGGGYAVPPMKYAGSVEKAKNGKWIAKIKKAIFAS